MLGLIRPEGPKRVSLLDFGCGASHLYEYIVESGRAAGIDYSGLDLSAKFIGLSRQKFPQIPYYCLDILMEDAALPKFDYVVANGVFTEKCRLSFEEMLGYFKSAIKKIFEKARIGIAFNVMSSRVDWERPDLFHVPFDPLAVFLASEVSRHFVIRHDYRLYEYTVYVYR
jgi:SAM-dependent methyltransferase